MTRLIVIDDATSPVDWSRLRAADATDHASHGVPYVEWHDGAATSRALTVDGPLYEPHGSPPEWRPRRRAAIRALAKLAAGADHVLVTSDDPLFAVQIRDAVGAADPTLSRGTRTAAPPWDRALPIDDLAAESRAVRLEIDAMVAHVLRHLDPRLSLDDLVTLGRSAGPPRTRTALMADGCPAEALHRLAEHGYLVDDPCWSSPAGDLLLAALPGVLTDPETIRRCGEWIDAVARGTVDRPTARERALSLIGSLAPPARPGGFDAGRLIGPCPSCGDWMGGARGRMCCMGCGTSYPLPRQTEILAVPGEICPTCRAPLVRPIVHGRIHPVRCPDRAGCPDAMDAIR